jgi:ribosomally synthesized peptide (two-chain TOMM family)
MSLNLDVDLMSLRTTWLRAIALAWSDPAFEKVLLSAGNGGVIKLLTDTFPPFVWPWPGVVDLAVKAVYDQTGTKNLFRWVGDDWVWPADKGEDSLTIYLPIRKAVAAIPEAHRVSALADYYDARPSIFGKGSGGSGGTPRGRSLVTSASVTIDDDYNYSIADMMLTASPIRFGKQNNPTQGEIAGAGTFLDFEVILISAMAKAWREPAFADLLLDPQNLTDSLTTLGGSPPAWKLHLEVQDDPTIRWIPASKGKPSGWDKPAAHQLMLNLPARPLLSDQPLALAAYNSTGAMYPFSCCA